jgi:hypothetical protein
MKKCSKCKKIKLLSDFNNVKTGKLGVHHYCKICLRENKKSHYDYTKNKLQYIKNKYNLSEIELNQMYVLQEKKCKICKKEFNFLSKHKGLYIDHCHNTGKVRGLLCRNCNALLGNSKDNIDILYFSILYLKSHNLS